MREIKNLQYVPDSGHGIGMWGEMWEDGDWIHFSVLFFERGWRVSLSGFNGGYYCLFSSKTWLKSDVRGWEEAVDRMYDLLVEGKNDGN